MILATKKKPAVISTSEGTDWISPMPRICPRCEAFTQWFRNINGRSGCINCIDSLTTKEVRYESTGRSR